MIVLPRGRFISNLIFWRIPKNASTSVFAATKDKNVLAKYEQRLDNELRAHEMYRGIFSGTHCTPTQARNVFGRQVDELFSFCVLRNPFDRAISQWSFSVENKLGKYYGLPEEGSFSDYCQLLLARKDDPAFFPTIPQYEWASEAKVWLEFEQLTSDWQEFNAKYSLNLPPLPHENQSQHKPWQEYYGPREREIVLSVFAADFENLGYSDKIA